MKSSVQFALWILWSLSTTSAQVVSSPPDRPCSKGFVYIPFISEPKDADVTPKCYRFFNQKGSFEDAIERCNKVNATLATPKHLVDAESLANYVLKNRPQTKRYWIGLSDQDEEGVFKWEDDGSKLPANFSSWTVTEPDSGKDDEDGRGEQQDCVKMAVWIFGQRSSAQFYDSQCSKFESFICEKDPIKVTQPVVEKEEIKDNGTQSSNIKKEVDFIVPKARIHVSSNKSEVHGSNESQPEEGEHFPLQVTANYEDVEESFEPGTQRQNESLKVRPEVSDEPSDMMDEAPVEVEEGRSRARNRTRNKAQRVKARRTCSLQCLPNHMKAACPLEYFPQMDDTKVVLNNASCRPRRNGTHLIVFTKLDHCGTVVENVPKKNLVSFRNTIHVKTSGAGIVRNKAVAKTLTELMVLDCRYPQRHSVSHQFHPAEGKPPLYKTQGEGEEFNHVMLLYKTTQYECPYAREEYPVEISLSKRVFLEVTLNTQSEQVELHPITCYATPDANPFNSNNYVMMQDGCIEDETFEIEAGDSRKVSRFSMEAFRFIGYFRQVYIHCKLIVCRVNSENSPECPFACDPENRERRRRAVEDESGNHERREISGHTGMIEIVKSDEGKSLPMERDGKDPKPIVQESKDDDGGENSATTTFSPLVLLSLMFATARIILS